MNNLKKKIFILLATMLSIFLFFIVVIFNVSTYNREKTNLKDRLIRINTSHKKVNNYDDRPLFLDEEVYIIKFNMLGEVDKIISNSNSLSENELIKLVNKNISKIKINKIDSLYSKYLFFMTNNNTLIVVNNSATKIYLINTLILTFVLFILLEMIILYVSSIITKWIVKPVVESFEKQKRFISDASHELKTPLAIISASCETIEGRAKDKKWINNIKEETDRMNTLVTNLLELSKTENENKIHTEVNLSKIIKNKSLSFESLMFENDISLETNIEDNIKYLCDSNRIKELLSILIDNGIKHADKKSIIKVELNKDKNNIYLSVTNKGKEIPLSEREKIFERFYRSDESRNRDSNRYGLGLSIAKNIVTNHNGKILVECNNGYTTFKVILKQK